MNTRFTFAGEDALKVQYAIALFRSKYPELSDKKGDMA